MAGKTGGHFAYLRRPFIQAVENRAKAYAQPSQRKSLAHENLFQNSSLRHFSHFSILDFFIGLSVTYLQKINIKI